MIKGKGKMKKVAGHLFNDELIKACDQLPDNETYQFLIVDEGKNRNLPYLSYLFSVVLTYISDNLPTHPGKTALYKFFEDMFAPIHTCTINDEQYSYCELKSEKQSDVNEVIEKIVEYASENWGIEVPRQEDMKTPALRELHSQAYLNQEIDWSNFLSSQNKLSKDERRIEKTKSQRI